ncbi:DegT/DnrJ/EryC1/StrS family aminotransferase [candidate division KSB1 bacterium]|nr:DegT/DnrJ/EryC1/StrS family aminotransferase [candidate division KSB1 bacterium]
MGKLAVNGGVPVRSNPFPKWPIWDQGEIDALTEVVKSGKWGSLHGNKVSEFEQKYAAMHNAKHGICINSGTLGLRIALMAAGIGGEKEEVIVPAYTFIASASAVIEANAVPVFVDIDSDTYNIDPDKVEKAITPRTKAIMPVHFGGRPADMDRIMEIAKKHNLIVIEDAAQAWGSSWKGTGVGAIGDAGAFSFQSSKNITSAEGGIILTNDDELAKFARAHSNCGRSADGQWYEHYYWGTNVRLTEFQGAVLLAQLARYPELLKRRQKNAAYLNKHLKAIGGTEPLKDDTRITSNSVHIYIWRYKKEQFNNAPRTRFLEALKAEIQQVSPGYSIPLYQQPVFKQKAFGPKGKKIDIAVDYSAYHLHECEKACFEECVWFNQNMMLGTEKDMSDIVEALNKLKKHADEL